MPIIKYWDQDSKGRVFNDETGHYYFCDSCTDEVATAAIKVRDGWQPLCKICAENKASHEPNCLIYICTCTRSGA